jgi:hypothetical protein
MSNAVLTKINADFCLLQYLLVSHAVLESADAIPAISLFMVSLVVEIQISLLKTAYHTVVYQDTVVEAVIFKMN